MKLKRNPIGVHPPLANYVQQIELNGNYRHLILSGQVGIDQNMNIAPTPELQFVQALANIKTNLLVAQMDIEDITKITIYLVDEIKPSILDDFFGDSLPCMTLLYIKALANPALKVEIDVLAAKQ